MIHHQIAEEIIRQTRGPFRAIGGEIQYKMVLPNGIELWHACAAIEGDEVLLIFNNSIERVRLADPNSIIVLQRHLRNTITPGPLKKKK